MVPVAYLDSEVEAELARGRLESEGIAAQVRFTAQSGEPAYAAGYGGLGAPLQTYEVLVADDEADEAREILRLGPRGPRRRTARRVARVAITVVVLIALVAPLLFTAWQELRLLF